MFLIVVIRTFQLLYKCGKLLQNTIIWNLNRILSAIEKSTLAALVLTKWARDVLWSSFLVVKSIACVWHANLFITAAMVKTQRKACEVRSTNIADSHARSFGCGDSEQTLATTVFFATTQQAVVLRVRVNAWSEVRRFL
jgi:hypothetical protein